MPQNGMSTQITLKLVTRMQCHKAITIHIYTSEKLSLPTAFRVSININPIVNKQYNITFSLHVTMDGINFQSKFRSTGMHQSHLGT